MRFVACAWFYRYFEEILNINTADKDPEALLQETLTAQKHSAFYKNFQIYWQASIFSKFHKLYRLPPSNGLHPTATAHAAEQIHGYPDLQNILKQDKSHKLSWLRVNFKY